MYGALEANCGGEASKKEQLRTKTYVNLMIWIRLGQTGGINETHTHIQTHTHIGGGQCGLRRVVPHAMMKRDSSGRCMATAIWILQHSGEHSGTAVHGNGCLLRYMVEAFDASTSSRNARIGPSVPISKYLCTTKHLPVASITEHLHVHLPGG